MTWVSTGVAVGGAVVSASSASKAGKAAKENAQRQEALMSQDLDERKRVARRQEGLYGPIEERLASMASANGIDPLRAGVVRQRIGSEFNAADRNILTMIGNRGVSSGLGAALLGGSQMNRARAMATGILSEYQNKDSLRMQLLGRYNPLQNAEFQSQGLRGMASFYGNEADRARMAEQRGWEGAGRGLMAAGAAYAAGSAAQNADTTSTVTSVNIPTEGLEALALPQRSDMSAMDIPPAVAPSGQVAGAYQHTPMLPSMDGASYRGIMSPSVNTGGDWWSSRMPGTSWGVMPTSTNFGIYGRR